MSNFTFYYQKRGSFFRLYAYKLMNEPLGYMSNLRSTKGLIGLI